MFRRSDNFMYVCLVFFYDLCVKVEGQIKGLLATFQKITSWVDFEKTTKNCMKNEKHLVNHNREIKFTSAIMNLGMSLILI